MTVATRSLLALLLALPACGGRSAQPLDGATLDRAPPGPDLLGPSGDRARTDQRLARDGGLRCEGPPRAAIDGVPLSVLKVSGRLELAASCCDAGEAIRFELADAAGKKSALTFQLLRFPGTPAETELDLAAPPKGFLPSVMCEPHSVCGTVYVRSDNSELSGVVRLEPANAAPRETVSVCLASAPKPGASPTPRRVELRATGVLVNLACVPGMDQTCNPAPISALYGSCNEDGTCSCNPGHSVDPVSGKCH